MTYCTHCGEELRTLREQQIHKAICTHEYAGPMFCSVCGLELEPDGSCTNGPEHEDDEDTDYGPDEDKDYEYFTEDRMGEGDEEP